MFLDGLHNEIGCRHCGSLMYPKVVDVKGHVAMVVFHSDHFNGKRGFHLRYNAFVSTSLFCEVKLSISKL